MKISIITVVYNNEKTIEDAINSVLTQSYKNIEYIIIDGKSNDNTINIINKYRHNIYKIISESDYGIYDAMNKGIKLCTGEVIGILNSDDIYYDNNVLERVAQEFVNNQSLDILYGNLVYVKSDNVNKIVRKWISKPYHKNFFEYGDVPPHPSFFVTKNVYMSAGVFDLKFKLAADYEFMLRVFKKNSFNSLYIDIVIVKMRLGGATNGSLNNIIKQNIEIINSWKFNQLNAPVYLMPFRFVKRLIQYL